MRSYSLAAAPGLGPRLTWRVGAGKIEHYAHLAGEDPPFGLRAASIEVLNRHLARTKAAARRKGAGAR